MASRWRVLRGMTPDGQALFECDQCGRVTEEPTPECEDQPCKDSNSEEVAAAIQQIVKLQDRMGRFTQAAREQARLAKTNGDARH